MSSDYIKLEIKFIKINQANYHKICLDNYRFRNFTMVGLRIFLITNQIKKNPLAS